MWSLFIVSALAQGACEPTTLSRLGQEPLPAIYVLGERKGVSSDPARAWRLVKKLAKRGPVTLALQAIPVDKQPILDDWKLGRLPDDALPGKLQIREHWGFEAAPYAKLYTAGKTLGIDVVAVGFPPEPPPEGEILPQPPSYIHVLADTMGAAPVPVELEGRFIAMVAYKDHRVAKAAIGAWEGQGALVILADRLHMEGGKGISWQAALMHEAPVHNVLLKASETPCYSGDLTLR